MSCHNGLPRLINDDDVDTSLPLNINGFKSCVDVKERDAVLPLPGKESSISLFISIIKVCQILSSIMKSLYTTTQRRNCDTKIKQLRYRLNNWKSEYHRNIECIIDSKNIPMVNSIFCYVIIHACFIIPSWFNVS